MTEDLPRERIPQLDALTGIRGLAAWLVVFYHMRLSTVELLPASVIAMLGKGYLAVDLFFMLSGFVMWLNYADRLRRNGLAELPHFWWKRFARIWPLHAAILCVLVAFAVLVLAMGGDASIYPFAELPLHFLLVQNWGMTSEISWNHPAWSISAEVGAYILFPFFALALRWEKLPTALLVAVIVFLAIALHLLFRANGVDNLGGAITRLGLWRCVAEFMIGTMLCNLWLRWRGSSGKAVLCLLAGFVLMAGGTMAALDETVFLPLGFAALLLALALDLGPFAQALGSRAMCWLGEISYATYLAHIPLLIAFKLLFVGDDLQLGWAGMALYLAMLLVLSALLHRLLEKPAQRWLIDHAPRFAVRPRIRA